MALIVNDMSTNFNLIISHAEEKLIFTFRQLTYKEKNKIAALTTRVEQGKAIVDSSLTCFYVIKYGLLEVEGLELEGGVKWRLSKHDEDGIQVNTDESIDALLNTEVSNGLIWAANDMMGGIPSKIVNPLTGREVAGLEIVKLDNSKKKS